MGEERGGEERAKANNIFLVTKVTMMVIMIKIIMIRARNWYSDKENMLMITLIIARVLLIIIINTSATVNDDDGNVIQR